MRFSEAPFANPFSSNSRVETTGSVPAQQPAPSGGGFSSPSRVSSAPLAPPPTVARAPIAVRGPEATTGSAAGWSAAGGASVVLAQGETVQTLSGRYGVPVAAIYSANGLANGASVAPGTRLTIPVYRTGAGSIAPAPRVSNAQPVETVRPTAKPAALAQAKPQPAAPAPKMQLVKGPEPSKPATVAKVSAPKAPEAKAEAPKAVAQTARPAPAAVAKAPVQAAPAKEAPAQVATAETKIEKAEPQSTGSIPPAAKDNAPDFRMPARGRIISGFKAGTNEGINIAVPEGTPVKAAEDGTVAYAGNELKGYGNMVLIRHENGWVSAYANNGDLKVKKGDKVRRGQEIARSGQTGNVTSPQLHFELRKGSTPVDPTQHLSGL